MKQGWSCSTLVLERTVYAKSYLAYVSTVFWGYLKMNELCVVGIGGVWFGVAYADQRVFASSFASTEEKALRSLLDSVPFNAPFQMVSSGSVFADKVVKLMNEIYEGKDVARTVPLATERFPTYTQKVLWTVASIPVGYVASYGGVAEAIGGGARAVGNVMATNCFAPLVPCHRVVASDFGLGGYGGGLELKKAFLVREKRGFTKAREIPVEGGKLKVFPVECVLRCSEEKA